MKTYCFKLYRSERNNKLHAQINAAGLIYNHCIALHKRYFRIFGKYPNLYFLQKHLTKLKKVERFSYFKSIGAQAVQETAARIDRAYRLYFKNFKRRVRCLPPNFKKVKNYKSFTLKKTAGWKLYEDNHTLKINGQNYRYFQSRKISGKVKTVTIKRDSLGDIYVYFVTDAKDIESPLFFARNSKLIANACRNLSRKIKDSNNRRKARLNLARLYKKTYNQRHDFHFKLARSICLEYEIICIEDLNLKGMQKLYGRKISDLAFSEFVAILKYEATKFGVKIIEVDRYFASSQICNCCGYKNSEVKDLKVRRWTCPHCGIEHDRDRNAAINILKNGLGQQPMQEVS